ncbi:hypothetical protein PAHAL_2G488600 [Panicum hallii]|jgi:uncharacterized protein (TIGR01568 family)|uniref:Transcription repressor n=1 Tax=Panicum hallii TaxID=206008 RepID=A0A2S3H4W5_9POAL|nr:transcription repressor OFP5-like [Panicum hallii]PAN15445.1 hypothetical protein PAHAL_2G488600 [Panicum hallii]
MSAWFYKLRRKRGGAIAGGDPDDGADKPVAPAPSPCSPNRASYYVPSRDRALPQRPRPAREDNPKLQDTQFPRSPHPSDIVFDVVARRDDRFKAMPELKLRPILTKPAARADAGAASDSSSAAASPTARVRPRFHARPPQSRRRKAEEEDEACRQKSRRRRRRRASRLRSWMYESLVVVKDSADPEEDFLESMAEMIAANGVRSPRGLEELLACYLALNAPDHHRAIVAAFRRAWVHLHRVPPTPRCMHESRLD